MPQGATGTAIAYRPLCIESLKASTGVSTHADVRDAAHPGRPGSGRLASGPASSTSARRASSSWAPWVRSRPPSCWLDAPRHRRCPAGDLRRLRGRGRAYGFIPGWLKAYTGAHEVVVTIMLNYVALAIISWAVTGPMRRGHRDLRAHRRRRRRGAADARRQRRPPVALGRAHRLRGRPHRVVDPLSHHRRLRGPHRGCQPRRRTLRGHAAASSSSSGP